jgi:formylglycine-generating enzyme required for sulfatase activity
VGSALAASAVIALFLLMVGWAWVRAWWVYPDLSQQQRLERFSDALGQFTYGGVTARLERGGMTVLGRSDIAEVGASKCTRESSCLERRRSRGCTYVLVQFTCAYAVKDGTGGAAAAVVRFSSNPDYSVGVDIPGSPKPLLIESVGFREAEEKLCELGFGCKPATGANPGAHAAAGPRSDAAPSASPPAGATTCQGFRAEVVGKGETCLDPSDPARREFKDCNNGFCGPAMVALPKGRGLRGSSAADIARLTRDDPRVSWTAESERIFGRPPDRFRSERPQREVTIGYQLAVGKFEVTFDAWDACVADRSCQHRPTDASSQARGARPVGDISWRYITTEFLPWLNRKLGLSGASAYRLLTEAEWEYAARAGTTTKYAFGDILSTAQARFGADSAVAVGSFAPNGFGLHDMHGNAAEWVQDCFEATAYDDAPVDGSAHAPRDCRNRALRGGSFADNHPHVLRSAYRGSDLPDDRLAHGFRVARTLVVR